MRHIFIVNPAAGKKTEQGRIISRINEVCAREGVNYQVHLTKGTDDARQKALEECRKCPREEVIRFYACGGDGTIGEVANGLAGYPNAQLAAIPCGTGNDFVKNFGPDSFFLDIAAQLKGFSHKIDATRVQYRMAGSSRETLAVNLCSLGFDADVALNMSKFKSLPFVKGSLAYTLSIFYCLIKKVRNDFTVTLDDFPPVSGRFMLSAICSGFCYGGDYKAAPGALVDDGELDAVLVTAVPRRSVPKLVKHYQAGDHAALEGILTSCRVKHAHIRSQREVAINIDGECFPVFEADFQVLPGLLNVSLPDGIQTLDFPRHYGLKEPVFSERKE